MFESGFENLLRSHGNLLPFGPRFSALIRDYFPEEPRKANLVLLSYRLGIVDEIIQAEKLDRSFYSRTVKKLMKAYGLERSAAEWAAGTWCGCYGRNILNKPFKAPAPSRGKTGAVSRGKKSLQEEKAFVEKLDRLLLDHGELLDYPPRFRGAVRDWFPREEDKANYLIMAYDLGIAGEMEGTGESEDLFLRRFAKKLSDAYGMKEENAVWTAAVWHASFSKTGRSSVRSTAASGSSAGQSSASSMASATSAGQSAATRTAAASAGQSAAASASSASSAAVSSGQVPAGSGILLSGAGSRARAIGSFGKGSPAGQGGLSGQGALSGQGNLTGQGGLTGPAAFQSDRLKEVFRLYSLGQYEDTFDYLMDSGLWAERDQGKLTGPERDYIYDCYASLYQALQMDPASSDCIVLRADGSGMLPGISEALPFGKPILLMPGRYSGNFTVEGGREAQIQGIRKNSAELINEAEDEDTLTVESGALLRLKDLTVLYESTGSASCSAVHILPKARVLVKDVSILLSGGDACILAEGAVEGGTLHTDGGLSGVRVGEKGFCKLMGGEILHTETGIATEGGDINLRDLRIEAGQVCVSSSVAAEDVQYVYMASCTLSGAVTGCDLKNGGAVVRVNYCGFTGNETGLSTRGGKLILVESSFDNSKVDLTAEKKANLDADFCTFRGPGEAIELKGSASMKMTNCDLDEAKAQLYDRSSLYSDGVSIGKYHGSKPGKTGSGSRRTVGKLFTSWQNQNNGPGRTGFQGVNRRTGRNGFRTD